MSPGWFPGLSPSLSLLGPGTALGGGLLIGAAAGLLVAGLGRIAGVSGILAGFIEAREGDTAWRGAFLLGLVASPWFASLATPDGLSWPPLPAPTDWPSWGLLGLAGLLGGFGSRMAGGCTSGHGVCGLARRSPRSLAAVAAFVAAGMGTVALMRHGGTLFSSLFPAWLP